MSAVHTANRPFLVEAGVLACVLTSALGCSSPRSRKSVGFEVVQTRFLGSMWNQGHAAASIVSQDGGFSYAVPGGSLWWFGDTLRGTRDEEGKPHFAGGAVSASVGLRSQTDDHVPPVLHYLTGADGRVAQAIGFLAGETWEHHRLWPLGGIYANGKSYIYYSRIAIGTGVSDFKSDGSGLACASAPLSPHQRITTADGWRFPVAPMCVVPDGDWLYLYEIDTRNERQGVWLSRVRADQIEDPGKYEFQCGSGERFCTKKARQRLLLRSVPGQVSVAWNEYLHKYVLVSASDIFRPREIRFHVADRLYGPWSPPVATITVPEERQGKTVRLVYCAYLHPELFRENGRIMNVTFSMRLRNAAFDSNCETVEVEIQ